MTPNDAVTAHKALATRLQAALGQHSPPVKLGRVQALHVVAALYGVGNWQTLLARPIRPRLSGDVAARAIGQALAQRGVSIPPVLLPYLVQVLDD